MAAGQASGPRQAHRSGQPRQARRPQESHRPRWFVAASWALVAAWACFIFYASSNTGADLNEGTGLFSLVYQALKDAQAQILGPDADAINSIAHFCEYALFGALWTNALRCHLPLSRAVLVAIACASLYGVTDELHQLFVPDRACDPVDWLVDTAGAALGALLASHILRRRMQQITSSNLFLSVSIIV
ncbi:VanZ family protein [Rubneribacter sp.]|nr:VanZ family protein [Candidatus Rubneribacter avistercoris]